MGRLLLVRLARRPGHRPLALPGKVRAWAGSRIDFGDSIAGQGHYAVVTRMVDASMQLRLLLLIARMLHYLLLLHKLCDTGDGDLEHGRHSGHRSVAAVSPGISQV